MSEAGNRKTPFWMFALVPLILSLGFLVAWFVLKPQEDPQRWIKAMEANNRGMAWMEQLEPDPIRKAIPEFEEVVRLVPDWTPGKINLGIALLNTANGPEEPNLDRAIKLFKEVLKEDPNNPYANYCIGVIYNYRGQPNEAHPYFKRTTEIDPNDPHAWVNLALTDPTMYESAETRDYLIKALELNPYLNSARNLLSLHQHNYDLQKSAQLQQEFEALKDRWDEKFETVYTRMGKYAELLGPGKQPNPNRNIGPPPVLEPWKNFQVNLAAGTRWATDADLGNDVTGQIRRIVRQRFGATMVPLDFNRDGQMDLFLIAAVVENNQLRDLLLKNQGNGQFVDVTNACGLGGLSTNLSCSVGDYNNDTYPDLLLSGIGSQKLFKNLQGEKLEDISKEAGFETPTGIVLGSGWIDIDQDSDLDLVVCHYGNSPEQALQQLQESKEGEGRLAVYLNIGISPIVENSKVISGRTTKFQKSDLPALQEKGSVVSVLMTDWDDDKDVDLLLLKEGPATALYNDRLLRFHKEPIPAFNGQTFATGLVLDVNHDNRSDYLMLGKQQPKLFLSSESANNSITSGNTDAPALLQAVAVDLDLDSWTDVVALTHDHRAIFLQNNAQGQLQTRQQILAETGNDLQAVTVADLDGDFLSDVILWSEKKGLLVQRSIGNGNQSISVELQGKLGTELTPSERMNMDGVGTKIIVQAGNLWNSQELTTLSAGLGQARTPLLFGIGKFTQAEVVRLRWPDGVIQAEMNISPRKAYRMLETNRKGTSCPTVLVWDGERYRFITDVLGAGASGEMGADGTNRPPRPEESLKIEPGVMKAKEGHYLIKITEPMDEIMYLDKVELLAIDHPANRIIYPDERFATVDPQPTQQILVLKEATFPKQAKDHRNKDVTRILKNLDRQYLDAFYKRTWLGFAEDHFVELDFGDQWTKFQPKDRLFLVMAGWTDYAFPESIFAATQAGFKIDWPVLEQRQKDGSWKPLLETGFPAGLPRVITTEVTGKIDPTAGPIRIRTNLQIFWDQIYLAVLDHVAEPNQSSNVPVRSLPMTSANLTYHGIIQEYYPNGKLPLDYDDNRIENVPISPWKGRFTRYGDVKELLTHKDDCFVISGPGDDVLLRFDAQSLPPLQEGWQRSYILKSWGYSKDTGHFTETAAQVEPLPYAAMENYPPKKPNLDTKQKEYDRLWNTRILNGGKK